MTSTLPLLFEGDGYELDVEEISSTHIRLLSVICYPDNKNGDGVAYRFFDLSQETKAAIIKQINRRYIGRMVKV